MRGWSSIHPPISCKNTKHQTKFYTWHSFSFNMPNSIPPIQPFFLTLLTSSSSTYIPTQPTTHTHTHTCTHIGTYFFTCFPNNIQRSGSSSMHRIYIGHIGSLANLLLLCKPNMTFILPRNGFNVVRLSRKLFCC